MDRRHGGAQLALQHLPRGTGGERLADVDAPRVLVLADPRLDPLDEVDLGDAAPGDAHDHRVDLLAVVLVGHAHDHGYHHHATIRQLFRQRFLGRGRWHNAAPTTPVVAAAATHHLHLRVAAGRQDEIHRPLVAAQRD